MRIQHSISAINSTRMMVKNQTCLAKNLEKLSSGFAINRSADDAAGLGISEAMRAKLQRLSQAERNALDGIGLIQTADGALAEMHNMLQVMNRLTLQSMNGTLEGQERQMLDEEYQQLVEEMDRIAKETNFNGIYMLDGAVSKEEGALLVEEELEESLPSTPAAKPSGPAKLISGNNFTINSGGVYVIDDNFKGTITIAEKGQDVLLKSESGQTLQGVSIDCAAETDLYIENLHIKNSLSRSPIIKFQGKGNSLNLAGSNEFTANLNGSSTTSLIHVGEGTELTLYESGAGGKLSVSCTGGDASPNFDSNTALQGALIGSGRREACGKIRVVDGTLSLDTTFVRGAGIGSGVQGKGGDIDVEGGTIDVKLWGEGAGIGGGALSDGGNITITGGEVNITNIRNEKEVVLGAGIGGGRAGDGGNIEISGDCHIRIDHGQYGFTSHGGDGAGIGGGGGIGYGGHGYAQDSKAGNGGNIHITGGTIDLRTNYGAGIGGGGCWTAGRCDAGDGGNISIEGGTIKIDTRNGAGIGSGGCGTGGDGGATGTVLITGGDIEIKHFYGAGIGAGSVRRQSSDSDQSSSSITILGGDIEINGSGPCAAIGTTEEDDRYAASRESAAINIDNVYRGGSITITNRSIPPNAIGDGFKNDAARPTKVKVAIGSNIQVPENMPWAKNYIPPGTLPGSQLPGGQGKPERGLIIQLSEHPEKIYIYIDNMRPHSLGLAKTKIDSFTASTKANKAVSRAIELTSICRGTLGACQNRLEHAINNVQISYENIQAAESRIRDTNFADEFASYTKNNILLHASQAMLTQANLTHQGVLKLLS